MIQGKVWTISNLLSLSRIVLMAPALWILDQAGQFHREFAVLILLVAICTDALDGYLARRLNQVSEMGKIIDPLADKVSVGAVVVMLMIFGDIPVWYGVFVLGRDLIIFLAGLYLKARAGIVLPSNLPGKFAVSFVALTLVLAILHYPMFAVVETLSMAVSSLLLGYSFILYAVRMTGVLRDINHSMDKG